jgi:hypothetical protein
MSESSNGFPAPFGRKPAAPSERADFELFAERNADKFIPILEARRERIPSLFRCWPGFFFPQAWFLYRKMYGWAAFVCVAPILAFNLVGPGGARWVGYAMAFVGLAGRRLYVASARGTIARIRAAHRDDAEARDLLRRAGGVSVSGALVGGLIVAATFAGAFVVALRARH